MWEEDSNPLKHRACVRTSSSPREKAHLRRRFYEIAKAGNVPLADDALRQIAALYKIEDGILGQSAEARCKIRQEKDLARRNPMPLRMVALS